MANRLALPALYVILDAALLPSDPIELTNRFLDAGVRLFQYRNKTASSLELLHAAQSLCVTVRQRGAAFILNDRPDVAWLAGANGVHLGQDDVAVSTARRIVGSDGIIGISTHNLKQFRAAIELDADYIAVGPVFATGSKRNPDPVGGIEFIRKARALTDEPIVAIGGITLERVTEVIAAGADSVGVVNDILCAKNPVPP